VLENVFAKYEVSPSFAMLAPDDEDGFRYILYLESDVYMHELSKDLDSALRANFHYDYCRKLGQLQAAEVIYVTGGTENYLKACQARGQKLGNIKPNVLQKTIGWRKWFATRDEFAV
jgi:hypothetical protein